MANAQQTKFDSDASAGLWIGFLLLLFIFGWPIALTFFVGKLILGSLISWLLWGNS